MIHLLFTYGPYAACFLAGLAAMKRYPANKNVNALADFTINVVDIPVSIGKELFKQAKAQQQAKAR